MLGMQVPMVVVGMGASIRRAGMMRGRKSGTEWIPECMQGESIRKSPCLNDTSVKSKILCKSSQIESSLERIF